MFKCCVNSSVILKTGGTLSSVSLATERAPPQEIPLHTILLLCKFFIFIFMFIYMFLQILALVVINLSNCMYVEF